MKRGPWTPIFKVDLKRGLVNVGITPPTPPPCAPTLSILGSVTDTRLDTAWNVHQQDGIAYVATRPGSDDRFVSVDVSDPTLPIVLDDLLYVSLRGTWRFVIVGDYAYCTAGQSIDIVDISTPGFVPVASFQGGEITTGRDIMYDGTYLYLVTGGTGHLTIVDISSPLAPSIVGELQPGGFNNLFGVARNGDYCFIGSSGSSRFIVVDVSDPTTPTFVTSLSGATNFGNAAGVIYESGYCYVCANGGLTIVDVSTPTSPTVAGRIAGGLGGTAQYAVKDGDYVYGATGNTARGVNVFNVSSPAAPTLVASINTGALGDTGLTDIAMSGDYLYVASRDTDRVRVIDVSTPASPTSVGTFTDSTSIDQAHGLSIAGATLYVVGREMFSALDISSPTSPALDWTTVGQGDAPDGMVHIGDVVYIASGGTGGDSPVSGALTAVDVSAPADLTIIGHLRSTNLASITRMASDGTYAYIARGAGDSIVVVDISDPTDMTYVTTITHATNLDNAFDVKLAGSYAYVVCQSSDRLTVIDITTPSSPSIVGSVSSTSLDTATSVAVSGNYAYVTALIPNRLTVVDISVPTTPVVVGSVQDATALLQAYDIEVVGHLCFVSCFAGDRVTVVDVTDPTTPYVVSTTTDSLLDGCRSIDRDGQYLYATAQNTDRLTILEASCIAP